MNAMSPRPGLATNRRSVVPGDWHAAKHVAVGLHLANARERQGSGQQQFAGLRHLPKKPDPNPGRLWGVVFEAVLHVGAVEPDLEYGIAGERQPVAAGPEADHA